jgi:hypothetical protein
MKLTKFSVFTMTLFPDELKCPKSRKQRDEAWHQQHEKLVMFKE